MLLLILMTNVFTLALAYCSYEKMKRLEVILFSLDKTMRHEMWGENAVLRQKYNDLVWSMEEKDEG